MKFDSIKFEISFLYTFLVGVILAVFTGVLFFILSSSLYHELDADLQLKAQEISSSIRAFADIKEENSAALVTAAKAIIEEKYKSFKWWLMGGRVRWLEQVRKMDFGEGYINFIDEKGNSLAGTSNIDDELMAILLKGMDNFKSEKAVFRNLTYHRQKIRLINLPFVYKDSRYVIQAGISPQPILQLLQNWLYQTIFSIPFILFLTSLVGWLLAMRFLAPVQKIIDTAQKISSEDLSSRVQEEQYATEMKSLVEAFNQMIARLEESFKHIEEFSSHVAHELKTPLTIIRGEAELTLRRQCNTKEHQEVLKIILEETQGMLKTIENLLYLSRLNYQSQAFEFVVFDFVGFFKEIYEETVILVSSRNLTVNAFFPTKPLMIKGDRSHLRRLFFNLIDNAIKFTPDGGRIDLAVRQDDWQIVATVTDTGKGIPQEHLSKIFDRFFHDGAEDGSGLGLSIVRSIVKIHNGAIEVESQINQGTTFKVILPASL